jgi:hypothetical protein
MDSYDKQRDDALDFPPDDDRDRDRDRDFTDALCGVSEPWHDLDSEGFPAVTK